jgi:hypothetical protein
MHTTTPLTVTDAASVTALKRTVVMAALAAITILEASDTVHAETDREKALEARVQALEKTVQSLLKRQASKERKVTKNTPQQPPQPSPSPPVQTVAAAQVTPTEEKSPKTGDGDGKQDDQPLPQPGTVVDKGAAPQELNVLRENTVTLAPNGLEISNEVDYLSKQTSLQRDRAIINNFTLRYGVLKWLEASMSVPLGFTTRTTDVTQNASVVNHTQGLGDISGQLNFRVLEQTDKVPGVVFSAGFQAPTGQSPFDFNIVRVVQQSQHFIPNPRNPLFDYYSQGSWVVHTNLQMFKTIDPVILFAGIGVDHVFPYSTNGYTISAFKRLIYNFGFSLALSEKTTLGFTMNGSYAPNIKVNGQSIFKSGQEPVLARLSIIQRLAKNWFLEPSTSFGVSGDSPDFIIGLGTRYQF